jgi:septal ring factor EnvC (AmiA/AmiB activator)
MAKNISILFFYFLIGSCALTYGQTRKQLEAERKKLKTEIKQVNSLLFETQKKEKNVLENLKDINQKIEVREKLIKTINLEAAILLKEINANQQKINDFTKKLNALKADYAAMIYKSYKSKSQQSRAMFLFSSQNFHQAYKRLQYMNQYTSYRKKQGEEIAIQTGVFTKMNDSLEFQKQLKDTLIAVERDQKKQIEADKNIQEVLVSLIKKKEKKYVIELKKKQKDEAFIAGKIDKLIKEEIAKANAKKGSKKSNGFILSPEAKALAVNFELNKGKLPWPVKSGLVTRRFGNQAHPTLGGITINSTGLHIVTDKGGKAQSVFNGEVLNVLITSEGRKNVLVRHGNYITAYNNLEKVYVKNGDTIRTGQELGEIFTDKVTGKTKLIFVLFKNATRLNPALWILKQ